MRAALLMVALLLTTTGAIAQSDTLTAGVTPYPGRNGRLLEGATHDLSLLDIQTIELQASISIPSHPDTLDELLIVKDGELNLSTGDSTVTLDPGGIALVPAGILCNLEAKQATYYRFRFRSRRTPDVTSAAYPILVRWSDIPVRENPKGETRPIFSRSTAWLSKIDLHATTLNRGEVSHPPHIHRAEEIILMRSGQAREYINGKYYPAGPGDLLYMPSGNPHALENVSTGRCQYFALQWQP